MDEAVVLEHHRATLTTLPVIDVDGLNDGSDADALAAESGSAPASFRAPCKAEPGPSAAPPSESDARARARACQRRACITTSVIIYWVTVSLVPVWNKYVMRKNRFPYAVCTAMLQLGTTAAALFVISVIKHCTVDRRVACALRHAPDGAAEADGGAANGDGAGGAGERAARELRRLEPPLSALAAPLLPRSLVTARGAKLPAVIHYREAEGLYQYAHEIAISRSRASSVGTCAPAATDGAEEGSEGSGRAHACAQNGASSPAPAAAACPRAHAAPAISWVLGPHLGYKLRAVMPIGLLFGLKYGLTNLVRAAARGAARAAPACARAGGGEGARAAPPSHPRPRRPRPPTRARSQRSAPRAPAGCTAHRGAGAAQGLMLIPTSTHLLLQGTDILWTVLAARCINRERVGLAEAVSCLLCCLGSVCLALHVGGGGGMGASLEAPLVPLLINLASPALLGLCISTLRKATVELMRPDGPLEVRPRGARRGSRAARRGPAPPPLSAPRRPRPPTLPAPTRPWLPGGCRAPQGTMSFGELTCFKLLLSSLTAGLGAVLLEGAFVQQTHSLHSSLSAKDAAEVAKAARAAAASAAAAHVSNATSAAAVPTDGTKPPFWVALAELEGYDLAALLGGSLFVLIFQVCGHTACLPTSQWPRRDAAGRGRGQADGGARSACGGQRATQRARALALTPRPSPAAPGPPGEHHVAHAPHLRHLGRARRWDQDRAAVGDRSAV